MVKSQKRQDLHGLSVLLLFDANAGKDEEDLNNKNRLQMESAYNVASSCILSHVPILPFS